MLKALELVAQVVKQVKLTFKLEKIHVPRLGMGYLTSHQEVGIYLERRSQLLNSFLRSADAL